MADEKECPGSLAKKKKRTKYYFYVNSQSEEADTLKDKFWRNLEEGKIDVMQTPDLYSKVKCNKKPLGLSVGNFGNAGSPVSTFDSSPSSSCGSSMKSITAPFSVSGYETGSIPSNSPLVDTPIHSPFRNLDDEVGQPLAGSDPSAASTTSAQHVWDTGPDRGGPTSVSTPKPTWPSASETNTDNTQASVADNKPTESSGTDVFLLDTNDDTLDCPSNPVVPGKNSGGKSWRFKRLKTKRRRNMSYSSRRRQKKSAAELSGSRNELNDESEKELQYSLDEVVKFEPGVELVTRTRKRSSTGKMVKSKGKKYYYLVEAGSKEADTLKDKFWRDVQEGKLNFYGTGDLYSKVKGSRKVMASHPSNDYDTKDGASVASPLSEADHQLQDECIHVKEEPVQLGRTLRQKTKNSGTRAGKERRHRNARLKSKSVSTLPESYVELIKTDIFPSDSHEAPKPLESDHKLVGSCEALETSAIESKTWLPATPSQNISSEVLQNILEPSIAPTQNQNDSKLLCTCAVTVERLRTEKIPLKEEQETEPKSDLVCEDSSAVPASTQSPITEPTASCELESGKDLPSSECAGTQNLCASPMQEAEINPHSFDDIDFDPNIALDDLCPSSDTDWPDVLELTEAVGRTLVSENPVLSMGKAAAIVPSATVSLSSYQNSAAESISNAADVSASYTEMRASLMNPLNKFNVSWPGCFNRRWGTQTEGALEYAVSSDDHQMAEALLKVVPKLTDLEKPDANGKTLLMKTVLQGENHLAELLIERGALVNSRDASGNTPLMMSAQMCRCSVAKLLLDNGAHIDLVNSRGETALMMAVNSGCLDMIKLLLIKGANFALANTDNLTAMVLAQKQQRTDISHLLNSHINRLMSHFQSVIAETIKGAAEIVSTLFPLHCFSLRDSTTCSIRFFTHKNVQANAKRAGAILFIGHAMIGEHTLHCLLHGYCAVNQAMLNGKQLNPLTKDGLFVTSFDSIRDGVNELVIHTIRDIRSEMKLLVCAYVCSPQK